MAIAATAVLAIGATGCGSDDHGSSGGPASTDMRDGVGLDLTRTTLTSAEQTEASTFAATYVTDLVGKHPELAGLKVDTISPVFNEKAPTPIGAMARLTLPKLVPTVELDLVRLHDTTPESIPSTVTNLRVLDMIVFFENQQVVHLGIEPQPTDAVDPATATEVTPLDPNGHRNPDFGGNE